MRRRKGCVAIALRSGQGIVAESPPIAPMLSGALGLVSIGGLGADSPVALRGGEVRTTTQAMPHPVENISLRKIYDHYISTRHIPNSG
jgi:hypothetical protein